MGQWSELPNELLKMIHEHLVLYVEKIRFRCVCVLWQSTSPEFPDLRQPQPPWLLLPYTNGSLCELYHPFENKVYEMDLPEYGEKVFKGSGHGWVVTTQLNGSINVVNPLTRVRVPLPSRYKFPDVLKYRPNKPGKEYLFPHDGYKLKGRPTPPPDTLDSMHVRSHMINKVVLSSSPTSNDFVAVALYGLYRLAYCKVGAKKWSHMVEIDAGRNFYDDITFYNGKFYALVARGELRVCDDIVSCPKLRTCVLHYDGFKTLTSNMNLVSSCDGLMAIERNKGCRQVKNDKFIYNTRGFKIFKLDMSSLTWTPMRSVGSKILFMGLDVQLGFVSENFKRDNGNQIYFVSDQLHFNCQDIYNSFDNGFCNFDNKKFKPLGYECNPRLI